MSGSPEQPSTPVVWGRTLSFWTRMALLWLMAITVTGAAVRLTGSGLGCTDWPTCEVNTELDAPGFHSAIEFGNRMISGLAILPVIAAWLGARRSRRDLLGVIALVVVGFVGQVVLGMLVTRTELDPRMVLGHFLLSIVLIFLGVLLDHRARTHPVTPAEIDAKLLDRARIHSGTLLVLTSVIIVLGTMVTGSGPHTGSEKSGEPIARLGFDIREITRLHSGLVWAFGALVLWGIVQFGRTSSVHRPLLYRILGLGAMQGAIGYLQYFTGVPVLLVALHIAGSVVLFVAVVHYAAETTRWSAARGMVSTRVSTTEVMA